MYLIIADDLTGACDAGIHFSAAGIPSLAALSPSSLDRGGIALPKDGLLAVNAATREMPGHEAGMVMHELVEKLTGICSETPSLVFKKIDSSLRGNPGAELDVLLQELPAQTALVAPALPAQGRTVLHGKLLIDGIPLEQTSFADDPGNPMRQSSIAAILGASASRPSGLVDLAVIEQGKDAILDRIRRLRAEGTEIIIFDGSSARHLDMIAQAGLEMTPQPLFTGSAGLAQALAHALSRGLAHEAQPVHADGIFFVCGSANKATHEQLRLLGQDGVPVLHLPQDFADASRRKELASQAEQILDKGSAALAAPDGRLPGPNAGKLLTEALANISLDVLNMMDKTRATDLALFMTGGETAFAILRQLGGFISLEREMGPGVVCGRLADGRLRGLMVILKAGGFGKAETLIDIKSQCLDSRLPEGRL